MLPHAVGGQVLTLQVTLQPRHSLRSKILEMLHDKLGNAEIYHLAVVPPDVDFEGFEEYPKLLSKNGGVGWAKTNAKHLDFLKG